MDGNGNHYVKQGKPGSEGKRSHIFSLMWKLDPKDKKINVYISTHIIIYIYIYMYIYTYMYIVRENKHVCNGERGKKKNDRQ
jgi:hypothetical protein